MKARKVTQINTLISLLKKIYHDNLCFQPFNQEYMSEFITLPEEKIQEDINGLLLNLSQEDKDRVLNLIEKMKKLTKGYERKDVLYTEEELRHINYISYIFNKKIIRVDDYYEYDGKFKLPTSHFESGIFLYKYGVDKLKTLKDMSKDKVIIDVGAFIGDSAIFFRDLCPENKIITFEPSKENYKLLLKTLKLNNTQNVVAENFALGDNNNKRTILVMGENSKIVDDNNGSNDFEDCKMDTLDNYVKKNNIKVGLIKVDIEGFEQYFLKGAVNTIKEQKPIMLLSIYHNYGDFIKIKPWLENLNLGYKFSIFKGIDNKGKWPTLEILLLCEV
jgi:FkbM family methyltransferase